MWQRWNQGTHIFEKSTDNGASWSPLGLNASIITEGTIPDARLSANVALRDVGGNDFLGRQHIFGGVGTAYYNAPIEIQTGDPRVAFHWPGVAASSIGMDTAATIRTYDNPGTNYAPFRASNIFATQWYYEAGRGTPQGHRITWGASILTAVGANCGGAITAFYSLIGLQLWWSIYGVNMVVPAVTPYLLLPVPAGISPVSAYTDQPQIRAFVPGIGDEAGYCQVDPNYIQVYRPKALNWPTGTGHVIGQGFYWIG